MDVSLYQAACQRDGEVLTWLGSECVHEARHAGMHEARHAGMHEARHAGMHEARHAGMHEWVALCSEQHAKEKVRYSPG